MASPRWLDGHEFEQAPGVDDGQEDWHAAVHGVSKSRTWLSDWTEPIPVFLSGEFQGQRSLVGYSLWGRKELDTCEWVIAQGHTGPGQLVSLSVSISFYNNTLNVLSVYPTLFQCANSNNNSNLALTLFYALSPLFIWIGSRKWQPTPVFLLGKSHGQRSLVYYSPWDHERVGMTEWLSIWVKLYSQHLYEVDSIVIMTLLLRIWSHREVEMFAQGHRACK